MNDSGGQGPRTNHETLGTRIVALLLLLEAISVFFLWTFDPTGPTAESTFALFLAADLVSFAMISYAYRSLKRANRIGRLPLLLGSAFISALLLLALAA